MVQALQQPTGLAPGTSTFLKLHRSRADALPRVTTAGHTASSPRDWPREHAKLPRLPSFQVVSPPSTCTRPLGGLAGLVKDRLSSTGEVNAFTVCIRTENQNQMSFYPFVLHEISVLVELILGHLRYLLTDVPPQPNSPPDYVFHLDRRARRPP